MGNSIKQKPKKSVEPIRLTRQFQLKKSHHSLHVTFDSNTDHGNHHQRQDQTQN